MKTGLLPVLSTLINIFMVLLCYLPAAIYLIRRLAPDKTYFILALFWLMNGIQYTPDIFAWSWFTQKIDNQIILFYNLLEAPMILLIFWFAYRTKSLLYLLQGMVVFEIGMLIWKGHNFTSSVPIVAVGSLIGLSLNIWAISAYFRKMKHDSFETTMAFANAGFIFYYGLSAVTLFFNYLNYSVDTLPYVRFINAVSIIMATGVTVTGLWRYARSPLQEELD